MRHRTHDHLFAAAGVTAALSLIGTGVTVLKGSVLEFSAWPVVGHDQPRRVTLPVAPVVLAPNGGTSSRLATIDGSSGGTAFPGLAALNRDGSPVRTLDFSLPAPVIVPRNGGTAGPGSTGNGRTQNARSVSLAVQGGAGSLGAGSSTTDGNHNAPGATPTVTPADPRTTDDKDADGVPDSWATDTGTPSTITNVVSDASGRDGAAPSFTAEDPGTDPSAGVSAPTETTPTTPTEPAPVPADPAPTTTDKTPSNPSPAPTPADPTPPTDTTTSAPAPPADPAPSNPTPPPTDTDPDPEPAPSQPAPPADPAPSQAPADPAPSQAPADPAPPADSDDDGDDCAPAAPAAEANAAVPQSAQ
jgi:hypothetical protein